MVRVCASCKRIAMRITVLYVSCIINRLVIIYSQYLQISPQYVILYFDRDDSTRQSRCLQMCQVDMDDCIVFKIDFQSIVFGLGVSLNFIFVLSLGLVAAVVLLALFVGLLLRLDPVTDLLHTFVFLYVPNKSFRTLAALSVDFILVERTKEALLISSVWEVSRALDVALAFAAILFLFTGITFVIKVVVSFAWVAFAFPEELALGTSVTLSIVLLLVSWASVALVIVVVPSFLTLVTLVVVVVASLDTFVALAVILVLGIFRALVALAVVGKLAFRAWVAASVVEELSDFAFVAFAFEFDFSFGAKMTEFVVVVESLLAVVACSVVVDGSLIATLDSALLVDQFVSLGTNIAEVVILVFLVFRTFSALVIVVVREFSRAAFLSDFNFSLGTFVTLSIIIDFSLFAFNALVTNSQESFGTDMTDFSVEVLFFRAVIALFVVEMRLVDRTLVAAFIIKIGFVLRTNIALVFVVVFLTFLAFIALIFVLELELSALVTLALVEVRFIFGTLVALAIILKLSHTAFVAFFVAFPVVLSSSAFLAFAVDLVIDQTFRASVAASAIVVRLIFRTNIALLIFVLVGSVKGTNVAFTVFFPFVRFILRANVAAFIIIKRFAFRANITLFVVVVFLTFFAFVAGSIVIVRKVAWTYTFLLFDVKNFWLDTVLAVTVFVKSEGKAALASLILLVPDIVARALASFIFLVPNSRSGAFSAFSFVIFKIVILEAFADLFLVVEVFSGSISMVITFNTSFTVFSPMFGCLALDAASVFFGENSGDVGASAFSFNQNLDSFTAAFAIDFNEWVTANTFAIFLFSVFFLRAQAIFFLLVPDEGSFAGALIFVVPASGSFTGMAFAVDPFAGRFAEDAFSFPVHEVVVSLFADTVSLIFVVLKVFLLAAGDEGLIFVAAVFLVFAVAGVSSEDKVSEQEREEQRPAYPQSILGHLATITYIYKILPNLAFQQRGNMKIQINNNQFALPVVFLLSQHLQTPTRSQLSFPKTKMRQLLRNSKNTETTCKKLQNKSAPKQTHLAALLPALETVLQIILPLFHISHSPKMKVFFEESNKKQANTNNPLFRQPIEAKQTKSILVILCIWLWKSQAAPCLQGSSLSADYTAKIMDQVVQMQKQYNWTHQQRTKSSLYILLD